MSVYDPFELDLENSREPRPTKKRDPIIRAGDRVRVVVPKFVKRVGYPKSVEDYVPEVLEAAKTALAAALKPAKTLAALATPTERTVLRIARELAYLRAKQDGFGGRERSIHFEDIPEHAGVVCTVHDVRTVMTGRYFAPSGGGYDYYTGESDYEPGGLDNMKPHRLASVSLYRSGKFSTADLELPVYHLEKLP